MYPLLSCQPEVMKLIYLLGPAEAAGRFRASIDSVCVCGLALCCAVTCRLSRASELILTPTVTLSQSKLFALL